MKARDLGIGNTRPPLRSNQRRWSVKLISRSMEAINFNSPVIAESPIRLSIPR